MDNSELQRPSTSEQPIGQNEPDWLQGLKVYAGVTAVVNLIWETLQLPLYTIWTTGSSHDIAFAVVHCSVGDVMIALGALALALVTARVMGLTARNHQRVMLLTIAFGIGYTVYSEWLNITVRSNWAYSPMMPIVPVINTGLSPLLQWIVIPGLALTLARKAALQRPAAIIAG